MIQWDLRSRFPAMVSRTSPPLAVLVALLVVLAACGGEEPAATSTTFQATTTTSPASTTTPAEVFSLVGQWQRAETSSYASLAGMIVEVSEDGTEAVIVTVPDNEFQFESGDVKWSAIEATGPNEYTFDDLVREEGSGASSHVEGVITVTGDGTLEMTFPSTGTVQDWVRVEP